LFMKPPDAQQAAEDRATEHCRATRFNPSILNFGLVRLDSEQHHPLWKYLDVFKGQVDVFHESTIVAHVVIAWKNRNRAVWGQFPKFERCREICGSRSTVLGLDYQRRFVDVSQLGSVKFRMRGHYGHQYGATADAERNPSQGPLEHRLRAGNGAILLGNGT